MISSAADTHKVVTMPQAPPSGFWYRTAAGPIVACSWPGCNYTVGAKHHVDAEYEFEKHVRGFHMRHSRDNYILGRRGLQRIAALPNPPVEPTVTLPPAPQPARRSSFSPRKVA